MAAFEYHALEQGRAVHGLIQAETARLARAELRERGLVPLAVEPVQRPTSGNGARLARERALILRQMASLLRAGLPLAEVLALVADQADSRSVSRPLAAIRARVIEGRALSAAMAEQPALFPVLYSRSVAAAEQAGQLAGVIDRLATHAERRLALARSLGMALIYPTLLVTISLAVVWGLVGFVVPRVVGVFDNAQQALPWTTQSLLAISSLVSEYSLVMLFGLLAVSASLIIVFRRPGPRLALDRFLLDVPLIGRLVRNSAAALFARTLAILLGNTVPAVEALQAAAEVVSNRRVRKDLEGVAARVREGASISAALEPVAWLPSLTRRLIHGGEQSGELPTMLEHAAELQEAALEDAGKVLLAVLQPLLILLVGLLVLYIVLAILMPIMNLSQLLG